MTRKYDNEPSVGMPPTPDDSFTDKLFRILEKQGVTAAAKQQVAAMVDPEPIDLTSLTSSIRTSIQEAVRELREQRLEGIATAVVLTAAVLIMNTQLTHIVSKMFVSRRMGLQATALITAPLLEELFKHLSIKQKATASYFLTFNFQELSTYVSLGISPFIRIPAVAMHFVTTLIQKHYCMLAEKSTDNDQARYEMLGYGIAVMVHAMFNSTVLLQRR